MQNFLKHKLIIALITVLALASFFTIYNQTKAGILISASDTMSRLKINTPADHEIAFRLTFATSVTENETITIGFSSGFASDLNGIDCGDIDLLDDGIQEDLNEETDGCGATATEWGASVSGGVLTLTAPSTAGTYIDGSSDVVIKIGTNATEEGTGDEQITNPSIPGNYLISIGGTFGDSKTIAIDIKSFDRVGITAQVGAPPSHPTDVTPPIIYNLEVINITQTSATVTWLTNEASTTIVYYGLTNAYGEVATGISFVTSHSVDLVGLTPDTEYHFQAVSADFYGNTARSVDQTFRTLALPDLEPPIISNIQVINITENSAEITWQTNELATSRVEYGLTTNYELGSVESSDLVASHSLLLTNLDPETTYHFRVLSTDAFDNEAVSDDQTFQTLPAVDIFPPIISNIQVINITENSAEITWRTDEPANSIVKYGLTSNYELGTITLSDLVTAHSISLFGLTQNTLYHFKVFSTDAAGNEAASDDETFRTLPDLAPPANVSNFRATAGDGQVALSWTNPPDPDFAGVKIFRRTDRFPASPNDGDLIYDGTGTETLDLGLTNGTTYYYAAFAYDFAGNFASGALASATPTAPPEEEIPPEEEVPPEEEIPPGGEVPPEEEIPPGGEAPPEEVPPEEIPPTPPFVVPPVTVFPEEKINFSQINFYTQGRALKLSPDLLKKEVKTLVKIPLLVELPEEILVGPVEKITFTFADSTYLLTYNSRTKSYEADFVSPDLAGRYSSLIVVFYQDNITDVIDFTLLVEPYGYVYEIYRNETLPVPRAKVTLFSLNQRGEWEIWPGEKFRQTNPWQTKEGGEYGFLVQPGTYYLKVEKEGYAIKETPRFEVQDNVINQNIEIFRLPVIEPTWESIKEIGGFVSKIVGENVGKVIDNPQVEETTEKVATPAVAAAAILSYGTAISLANLLPYLQFIFTQPILLLLPKRRKGWGIVYNSLSKIPLDLAIVRVYEKTTNRLVQTRVTDREGRYAFLLQPGTYYIKVSKVNFTFPTYYLHDKKEDFKYLDIYHGEDILVTEENALVTPNIPLDPVEIEKIVSDRKLVLAYLGRKLQNIIAVIGIVLAAFSVVISPKIWMVGILAAHCLLYGLFRRLTRPKRPKSWGIVYESRTGAPVGRAIARIFEKEYNKLLETQITDRRGRYSFLVANNIYYVTLSKEGYKPKRTEDLDLRKVEKGAVVGLDVALEKV